MMVRSIALVSLFALAACAEPVDDNSPANEGIVDPVPVVEESQVAPEAIDETAETQADENVPSLADVQAALGQCVKDREVLSAQCEATGEGTEFTCTYSLDGDTPETEREAMIAADGASYVLIDIPEECQQL